MSVVSIRLNQEESEGFSEMAKLYNCSIGTLIKRLAIEKLEDEFDLDQIRQYEKDKEDHSEDLKSFNELISDMNL